jgi:hypothetical protein
MKRNNNNILTSNKIRNTLFFKLISILTLKIIIIIIPVLSKLILDNFYKNKININIYQPLMKHKMPLLVLETLLIK